MRVVRDSFTIAKNIAFAIIARASYLFRNNSTRPRLSCKHTSAISPSDVRMFVTVISFFVNVPVLSEQITVTQPENTVPKVSSQEAESTRPSVSTIGSFFTIASRLAMR